MHDLSALTLAAAECTTFDEVGSRVLRELSGALNTSLFTAFVMRDERVTQLVQTERDEHQFVEYARDYEASDPLRALKAMPLPEIAVLTQLVDKRTFTRSEVFNDYYRPHDIAHLSLATAAINAEEKVGMFVCRSHRAGDFSHADIGLMQRTFPLIRATLSRVGIMERLQARSHVLEALADARGDTLAFDADGELLWMAAKLRPSFSGALADQLHPLRTTARTLCLAQAHGVALAPEQLRLRVGEQRFDLALVQTSKRPSVIATLVSERLTLSAWAAANRITASELRVLQALASGLGNDAIAAQLFVSVDTVRTHLAHCYTKLKVSSRAQVMVMMQGLV